MIELIKTVLKAHEKMDQLYNYSNYRYIVVL